MPCCCAPKISPCDTLILYSANRETLAHVLLYLCHNDSGLNMSKLIAVLIVCAYAAWSLYALGSAAMQIGGMR